MSFHSVFGAIRREARALGHKLTPFERRGPTAYVAHCTGCRCVTVVRPIRPAGEPLQRGLAFRHACDPLPTLP